MSTDEQQAALEALYEHEGLTDNLTDDLAKALLSWAETQIKAGRDPGAVQRAMRAANSDAFTSAAAVVQAATTALPTESAPPTAEAAPVIVAGEPPAAGAAPGEPAAEPEAEATPAAAPEVGADTPVALTKPPATPNPQAGPRQPSALERLVNQLAPNPLFRARKPSTFGSRSSQSPRRTEQRQAPQRHTTAEPAKDAGKDARSADSQPQQSSREPNEPRTESGRREKRRSKGKQRR